MFINNVPKFMFKTEKNKDHLLLWLHYMKSSPNTWIHVGYTDKNLTLIVT